MNETYVTVRGNLGSDPTLYTSEGKRPYTRMTVANTPRRRTGPDAWGDGTTTWYVVKVTGKLAHNAAASLRKGDSVLLRGPLTYEQWEHEGKERSELVIWADALGPDLNNSVTTKMKVQHEQRSETGEAPGSESAEPSGQANAAGTDEAPLDVSSWAEVDTDGTPVAAQDEAADPADHDPADHDPAEPDPAEVDSIAGRLTARV